MKAAEFDYYLPKELIAQHPLRPRHSSRLMVLGRVIEHRSFSDIADYLEAGDTIVLNRTKVVRALIHACKQTGGRVTVLLVSKMSARRYKAILHGKRLRIGTVLVAEGNSMKILDDSAGCFVIEFDRAPELDEIGEMPLPPYIKEGVRSEDEYQTIYASEPGSIAAPTAGFHFSRQIFSRLRKKGVNVAQIVLHIGMGTFQPVKCGNIEEHRMHREYFVIDRRNAGIINRTSGKLIAVGTTTMRCLESAAMPDGCIKAKRGWTSLFIYPGYRFRSKVAALITNFHLPRSTLLMLVSAFAGRDRIMRAYGLARLMHYRFYSFGDAMLLFRERA